MSAFVASSCYFKFCQPLPARRGQYGHDFLCGIQTDAATAEVGGFGVLSHNLAAKEERKLRGTGIDKHIGRERFECG